jgi:hypothetical protein
LVRHIGEGEHTFRSFGEWHLGFVRVFAIVLLKLTVELSEWPRILNQHFPTNAAGWSISPGVTTSMSNMGLYITRNVYNSFMPYPTIVFKGQSVDAGSWSYVLSQLEGYAKAYVTRDYQFIYMAGAIGKECRFFRYKKGDAVPTTWMVYNLKTKRVSYEDPGTAISSDIVTDQDAIYHLMDEIISKPVPLFSNIVEFDTEHSDVQADVETECREC